VAIAAELILFGLKFGYGMINGGRGLFFSSIIGCFLWKGG